MDRYVGDLCPKCLTNEHMLLQSTKTKIISIRPFLPAYKCWKASSENTAPSKPRGIDRELFSHPQLRYIESYCQWLESFCFCPPISMSPAYTQQEMFTKPILLRLLSIGTARGLASAPYAPPTLSDSTHAHYTKSTVRPCESFSASPACQLSILSHLGRFSDNMAFSWLGKLGSLPEILYLE